MAVVLILTSERADAWDTANLYGDQSNFRSGIVEYYFSWDSTEGPYYRYWTSSGNFYLYYAYFSTSGYYDYSIYKGWLGVPVSSLDTRTNIESATIYVSVLTEYNWDTNIYCRILAFDPSTASGEQIYTKIDQSPYYVGSVYVSSTGTFAIGITGSTPLNFLRSVVSSGAEYVYFGFYGTSSNGDYVIVDVDRSYLSLTYDASPPYSPTVGSLSTYTSGDQATVSWTAPSDRPSGGNSGLDPYPFEVGVFENIYSQSLAYSIYWIRSDVTDWTLTGLVDGKTYYFRVRARDAYGFESGWSGYVATTMDASPPTVPVLEAEPPYTSGTSNIVQWTACTDAGIGVSFYQVQRATNPGFAGASTYTAGSTQYAFASLSSGTTYYYRVRAVDGFGYYSEWSTPQTSTQDDDSPSLPVMMAEPLYTPGSRNTFSWHPSADSGVGVGGYRAQVASSPGFGAGTIVLAVTTTETHVTATGLADGTTYYARASAIDLFGYVSEWSAVVMSSQDASGPQAPGLHALPMYSMEGPVSLVWDGAVDDGVGVGWYSVLWTDTAGWSGPVQMREHVLGHTFDVTDLEPGKEWYFRVVAFDSLGNGGLYQDASTTIDGEPPEAPAVDGEPAHTAGWENTITWQAATDALSGVDHYVVRAYARANGGLVYTDMTDGLTMTVPGLADGATYWYEVVAVDAAGNVNASELVSSTQDASPPTVPRLTQLPAFTAGVDVDLDWPASQDRGSGGVQYLVGWAMDPAFSVGAGDSGWVGDNTYSFMASNDDVVLYFRVKARDALGHESMWSDITSTFLDDTPPPTPAMDEPEGYVPGPAVPLSWSPVWDSSGQRVEYMVIAYDGAEVGATQLMASPWLSGTGFAFTGLDENQELYFRVVARDALGWESDESEAVMCTIDAMGPSAAVIAPLGACSKGTGLKVTWTAATDDGVGGVMHRLVTYSDPGLATRVHASEWNLGTSADVHGLVDGMRCWFVVEARDAFGNAGEDSVPACTSMDASPPAVALDFPGYYGGAGGAVTGSASDAGSGVASVEWSYDGNNWTSAELTGGKWSFLTTGLPLLTSGVMVRATDAVGNVMGTPVVAPVDITAPTVRITLPKTGDTVSGVVPIVGLVSDAYLSGYIVEVQRAGASSWMEVQPMQSSSGISGTLATWVTSGMAGGDYTIRITAMDALDQTSEATVVVTLKGAHLSIGTSDISFSDSHPLPGDRVTVLVTVRNDGASPAENVLVRVYDRGKEVGSSTVTVPARGTAVVPVTITAKGDHELTARATSDLYDTGEMPTGQPLSTIEEEATLENAGGILGLVALILALVAILLVLLLGRRRAPAAAPEPSTRDDVIIDPVLEDVRSAPAPGPAPSPSPTPAEQPFQQPPPQRDPLQGPPSQRPRTGGFR